MAKPFWDVDETRPFKEVSAWDGMKYKVLTQGYNGQPYPPRNRRRQRIS